MASIATNPLTKCHPISKTQRNALHLTPNPHMFLDQPILPIHLDQLVRQGIFAKERAKVRGKEVTGTRHGAFGCEAGHVGRVHDVLEICLQRAVECERSSTGQ